ncbi:MAG: hypothetical protein ACREDO_04630 [Methyloceanibacter sp.]
MSDLRIENPATTAAFVERFAAFDVKLPLALHDEEVGSVIDADKREVFVVDVNRERTDGDAEMIATWIVLAVNTCGGFRAEVQS